MRIFHYVGIIFLISVPFYGWAFDQYQTEVRGYEGRSCTAYLNVNSSSPKPLVISLAGTGIYSMGQIPSASSSAEGYLLSQGKVSVLTIDKPGIVYSDSSPGFVVKNEIFNQYIQKDMVFCLINALKWALEKKAHVSPSVFIIAHSEGAQIVVRAYEQILKDDVELSKRIRALFLSGSPLESWRSILNWQMRDSEDRRSIFWRAVGEKNNSYLLAHGGVSSSYLLDVVNVEPLIETLKRMALSSPDVSFYFYHGLKDENTNVEPLLAFESWNQSRKVSGMQALHLSSRYYNADHGLNLTALNDLIAHLLLELE